MFDGPESPITQTFGLALLQPARPAALDAVERFFHDRGAPVNHEVSPMADAEILKLLGGRGYHPTELTSILYRPIEVDMHIANAPPRVRVREIGDDEHELWGCCDEGLEG